MTATPPTLTITPYQRRHRRVLLELIEQQVRVHVHLDWTTIDDWINDARATVSLAFTGDVLLGVLAVSPPLGATAWMRLAAVHDDAQPERVLPALWPGVALRLREQGIREAGILMLRSWLAGPMEQVGFGVRENVVSLMRNGGPIPTTRRPDLAIRHGDLRDLDAVVAVDHAAFPAIWRMPIDSIRQAIRGADSFTMALHATQVIGYQISMRYSDGGHLARLATVPAAQGMGVGGALLGGMLSDMQRRGVYHVTVNTQETNRQSISLYQRFGFAFSGLDYPVYTVRLTP